MNYLTRVKVLLVFLLINGIVPSLSAQKMKLGLLVYGGGGDWYANPTSLKNLARFCNTNLGTSLETQEGQVEVGSRELLNYPIVFATGHGRIMFNDMEAQNLRTYLTGGGFLQVDDNYGLDKYIRPAMKKVFPELDFANGLPKIHEHEGKQPKGWGLIYQGRVVCFYSFETDLNDGWEDPEVHKDPEEKRQQALRMGANIIQYAFMNL